MIEHKGKQYRAVKDAAEFEPHRDRWVKDDWTFYRIATYLKVGIVLDAEDEGIPFSKAFEKFTFDDGTPFGVVVEPTWRLPVNGDEGLRREARVRESVKEEWRSVGYKFLGITHHEYPYAVVNSCGFARNWRFCEVRDIVSDTFESFSTKLSMCHLRQATKGIGASMNGMQVKATDVCANCYHEFAYHNYIADSINVYQCPVPHQESGYGGFKGGDPRTFCPDHECCTEKEMDDYRKACELWNEAERKGETPTPEKCPSGWIRDEQGKIIAHVLASPYGIGIYAFEFDQFWEPGGEREQSVSDDDLIL